MTEQQIDLLERELDYWQARAYEAEKRAWKAEKRLAAWMEHWNATARTGAVDEVAAVLDANARADQAEARIMHLEATAQVLVKEALDAENARDESRRGKAEAKIERLENRAASETARADAWREKHRIMAKKRDAAHRARQAEREARRKAEARIKAVEDVLAAWHVEPGESGLADDLLRALDGDA